ncbi:hypothetical protein ACFODT_16295 [Vibrio zhugei]|uniref:Uncharacterized protein n=1 Tax=Vibrio zhugei TaxID=2479546 RepID=A0ABV7CBG6_9VIBR|nr:hypothetical protein [Vibrio zhugei]
MKVNLKSPYFIILTLWLLLLGTTILTSNGIVAAVTIFITGLLPFLLFVFWFSVSLVGKSIRENLKKWHWAVIFTWVAFAYALFAQKWTASFLNEIFYIDGSSLGITSTLLAVLFTPFGIFYQETVVGGLWNALIFAGLIWGGLLPILFLLPIGFKKVLKILGVSLLVIFLFSFFVGTITNLSSNAKLITKQFALWADFNSNHLCTDSWSKEAASLLYLGGDRVLVYSPIRPVNQQFHVEHCNFERNF